MNWTAEQQQVISLRNRNILVSAAAGSGKTAVLVERIISRITEGEKPVNIDELLVVTFTKAAAAEMRERIGAAIEKKIMEQPNNVHLQKQTMLLHNAKIMTIDSFCLDVIRNYFHFIDLDPGFRISDEAECTLLKSDVLNEVLERRYEEGEEDFIEFVECYAGSKSDSRLEEYVLKLYEFSMSDPWSEEWLETAGNAFNFNSMQEFFNSKWIELLLFDIKELLKSAKQMNEQALKRCLMQGGPWMYEDALHSDGEMLDELLRMNEYEELSEYLQTLSFQALSRKRDTAVSDEDKEVVKQLRAEVKDILTDIKKSYFFQPLTQMYEDILLVKGPMQMLTGLTKEFAQAFAKKKEEKNIIDFHDMEHFALHILIHRENGENFPTPAADDLSSQYVEIMIDEYQDSNLVQETILNSISRERYGTPNVFMVGDVKQSIYKFRLARPELFMEKYDLYSVTNEKHQRIDLHKNFRSRAIILHGVNQIFYRIMRKAFGGIEYDLAAALYPGAEFLELPDESGDYQTELMLVAETEEQTEIEPDVQEYNKKELEAYAITKRIKELVSPEGGLMIMTKQGSRPAEYRDIVILLRTMSGWSECFLEAFANEGIRAYAETRTGYFKTLEIKVMLNFLRILDNPRQDIAFTSVLYSPFVTLTSKELAEIRIFVNNTGNGKLTMYESALLYALEGTDAEIVSKLKQFFLLYDDLRLKAYYLSVHNLIRAILKITGYDYYVLAMPAGEQRKRNLDMLIKQAVSFEETSYRGLFQFIRYVERLIKYDVDYGESGGISEQDNAVRIMSIHKSKGLEFPIVFLSGMGKKFNQSDTRASLVLHPEHGIGPDLIDYKLRTKTPTLLKKIIKQKSKVENLSEELRVLYVAMTRAKEKLIMTGYVKDALKVRERWENIGGNSEDQLSLRTLVKAETFLSFVGPALSKLTDVHVSEVKTSDLVFQEVKKQWRDLKEQEELLQSLNSREENVTLKDEILHQLNFVYPYIEEAELPIKTSVSELKKQSMHTEECFELYPMENSIVPKFLGETKEIKASDVGTLNHILMESLDFAKAAVISDKDSARKAFILEELNRLEVEGKITPQERKRLYPDKFAGFLSTDLARRMSAAAIRGRLFKEQRFVLSRPAKEIKTDYNGDAVVLLQGIIDVYFEEGEDLVLVDYKSDFVPIGENEEFIMQRYHTQLELYKNALSQITGKNIKEILIYSFHLSKVIKM